ncbi:spermidine/putrescine transport system permease protein [Dethiosulfatibacter aminovorans DSM 17477]|uniref:Spermidine/putrescine transport system permease protein n=1 Tax=Dethiosulfatibacter aminovorans DSM 17477 TaxID=1121476 RepID=A0A1M6BJG5_9FIRM|nr:ABC transporter permease [Dethiosulfatibacter aminovorans]SHI48872.1 spermidine/putrescine transport system permease protein [Dethiosulfatibacter aminovorans DSM 17477]
MKSRQKYLAYPYTIWMALFIILPVILVFLYSITVKEVNNIKTLSFTLDHYSTFFDPLYLEVLGRSLALALISTVLCLAIGYPVAYLIANMPEKFRNTILMLFILPMWMNMLLRTYSWMTILGNNGLINNFFNMIGLPKANLLYNNRAIIIGMVYNFLPFMVLPIYTVLNRMDRGIIEAAYDLGADSRRTFFKVILPLSMPGVISGIVMVFMPAVSSFVIPRLLGGNKKALIGTLIEKLFLVTGNWNFGSAVAIIMMIIILLSMSVMNRFDVDKEGGGGLW